VKCARVGAPDDGHTTPLEAHARPYVQSRIFALKRDVQALGWRSLAREGHPTLGQTFHEGLEALLVDLGGVWRDGADQAASTPWRPTCLRAGMTARDR